MSRTSLPHLLARLRAFFAWRLAILACGLSILLPCAAADESAGGAGTPPFGDTVELERFVVTATRRAAPVLDVVEAVTVIEGERIRRESPDVLAEAMRGTVGVFFQQTTPGQGIPIIRGLKGSEVLHLVDGMRLNNAFFRNAPNQYLALVDAYAVRRIEVIRGSAPSLHGSDAMGGVVQVLTPEPEFRSSARSAEGRVYSAFSSVDHGIVARAEGATGTAEAVLSGGFTFQDYGDREAGGGETLAPTGFRVRAGDLKWRSTFGGGELMLSAQVLEQPSTPRTDELLPGYGQELPNSSLYEFQPNRRSFLHARYRRPGEGWFERLEVHAARQVITDDRVSQELGGTERVQEFNQSTLDGLTVQFNTPWGNGDSVRTEIVWGAEFYADTIDSSRRLSRPGSSEVVVARGRFPDRSSSDSQALYAANRWHGQRLIAEAGLRYSRFDTWLPAEAGVPASRLEPDDLTGDVHLSFALSDATRLITNIGRGFRAPNVFDLGTLGPRPGNRFNAPNPALAPETVWSYDLGIKAATVNLEGEVFAFYSDYRDRITSVLTGDTTADGRLVVRSENVNEAELYGIEAGLRWQMRAGLETYAVVNYTRGEERGEDRTAVPADRIPPLNGRLGLVYAPGNGWRVEPWLDFAAEQDRLSPRDETDPRMNPEGTDGYAIVNVAVSWQATAGLELGLRLDNLGDENYREHGSGLDAPGRGIGVWLNAVF